MATNLETKNSFEGDVIREGLDWLDQEVKISKKIDETFNEFDKELNTKWEPDYILRSQRDLSIEMVKDHKIKLKSYGEICEIDLHSGLTSYMKWNTPILLGEIVPEVPIMNRSWDGEKWNFEINTAVLKNLFWQINVINRSVSMAKKSKNKEFSFWSANFFNATRELKVDWKNIISVEWLRKWFTPRCLWGTYQHKKFEKEFIDMLNRIVL